MPWGKKAEEDSVPPATQAATQSAGQTGKKDCVQLKKMYEECFRQWYTDKFLRGEKGDGCVDEWNDYKECMTQSIKAKNLGHLLDDKR